MARARWLGIATLLVLLIVGGVGWTQRVRLQTWWVLRSLSRADEANRAVWLDRVARLGEPAVEPLLECLVDGDEMASANALAALDHLARLHGVGDPVTVDLADRMARCQARLDPARRVLLLRVFADWFRGSDRDFAGLIPALAHLLRESGEHTDPDAQMMALELATIVVRQPQGAQDLPTIRAIAQAGLRSSSDAVRLRAVQLCLQPGVELLDQVVGLLKDKSARVRQAAVLAVGPVEAVVREDGLLPGLHDPDAEVRRLTEVALRGRGVRTEHLELGRLLTHPKPASRLQVIDHIRAVLDSQRSGEELEIDPGVWLRRLSHDSSPAVRAAALRLMSEQTLIDLTDRIDQMARSDPNPSVSQLARFYLDRKRKQPPTEN